MLLGRITGPGQFDPRYGFIVQNKDDFNIPLDLETIPSAKEFKEAISSLSPEQQRFAEQFRAMQLESTLFGICVLQIKPQLERLLNLPSESLTKEIQLTQQLLDLFLTYQIPSDLLSFDGDANLAPLDKVAQVKHHVAAMNQLVAERKRHQTQERLVGAAYSATSGYAAVEETGAVVPDSSVSPRAGGGGIVRSMMNFFGGTKRREAAASSGALVNAGFADASNAASPPKPNVGATTTTSTTPTTGAVVKPPSGNVQGNVQGGEQLVVVLKPSSGAPTSVEVGGRQVVVSDALATSERAVADYTALPREFDSKLERYDKEGRVRPTIINVSNSWRLRAQKSLLLAPSESTVNAERQSLEKERCYDLLDSLSKTGLLPFEDAQIHVVICATHTFDDTLMDTLVQKNINPIERVERSQLILATTVHGRPATELLLPNEVERVKTFSAANVLANE